MAGVAFATLDELGYRVDCSSTPQRPGILSSYPLRSPWLTARREPYFVSGQLLEVPTSCFLFPLGSPTFLTLRRAGSMAFLRLLALEARVRSRSCLTSCCIRMISSSIQLPRTRSFDVATLRTAAKQGADLAPHPQSSGSRTDRRLHACIVEGYLVLRRDDAPRDLLSL